MKILVTGSSGFIGSRLAGELLKAGHSVIGTCRSRKTCPEQAELVTIPDIGGFKDWASLLREVDAVAHLAGRAHVMVESSSDPLAEFRRVNVEGTKTLAEAAAAAGVKKFVFLSSIKVNGEQTIGDAAFKESDTPHPSDAYAISKWEAELGLNEIAAKTGMKICILRPPLVYGPGVKANFLKLVDAVAKGKILPLGGIRNSRSLIGLSNLCDVIMHCLTDEIAASGIYLVSDGEDFSTPELIKQIAKALDRPVRMINLPEALIHIAGFLTGKSRQVERLCGSLKIDSNLVRDQLRWSPPQSLGQELAAVAEWYWETRKITANSQ